MTTTITPLYDGNSLIQTRRRVSRAFKMRGLILQASALDAVLSVLKSEPPNSTNDVLHSILDEIQERMISSTSFSQPIVSEALLSSVIADMSRNGRDVQDEALQLLDSFRMPRLAYNVMRTQFSLVSDKMEEEGGRSLFGEAIHKVEMLLQRYALIQQRILRQDLFRPRLLSHRTLANGGGGNGATHAITPIESLLGRVGVRFLLGMIVQVEEGHYYLADHTSQVPLDTSKASVLTNGFITENCIVLVEGEMIDSVFHVHRMGNPLIESREDAIDHIGLQNCDMFQSIPSLSELEKMREQEILHGEELMFVILSDVHLDNQDVLAKLGKLLEGYQDVSPLPVFVLMGNLISKPSLLQTREGPKAVGMYFEELANLICQFKTIAEKGRFIFIPGPNDPGLGSIMPRPPIPKFFTKALRSKVPHATFASNPCRIRYFSKEIVFCRQDIVNKLRRNCVVVAPRVSVEEEKKNGEGEKSNNCFVKHAVQTMLDQSHLCPLPLSACPIYWQYDHALRLYPLPDAIVVGDSVDPYYENYAKCDAINPGPFSTNFDFVAYRPIANVMEEGEIKSEIEFSQVE